MLLAQIKTEYLAARKARETDKVALLSTLIGEIETLAKAGKGEMTDAVVVTVVKKFIKNNVEASAAVLNSLPDGVSMKEAAEPYHKIGVLNAERKILEAFLPKQLTEAEISSLIDLMIASGAKDVGDCMKLLKTGHAGTYDGAVASRLLKARFA
jgi:uncharacterized protein YqeY